MNNKWRITPKKIGRSRKIQVRQFEPEEIWIEYEIDIEDHSLMNEAVQEATKLATEYLDGEERKLRRKTNASLDEIEEEIERSEVQYTLEITNEGKSLGNFKIKASNDPQYANFLHLWLEKEKQEFYVGYLLKDGGEFKFKSKNRDLIQKYGIKKGIHFKIIPIN
jgi:hypothetical protein